MTTVAWTFMIAALRAVGIDSVLAASILGIAFEMGVAVLIVILAGRLIGNLGAGALVSVFLVTNPLFVVTSLGGMEIALSLCIICLTFLLLSGDRPGWAMTVAAMGIWVRVDNLLLLSIVAACVIIRYRRKAKIGSFIPAAIISILYLAAAQIYYGTPIPVSVLRKIGSSKFQYFAGVKLIGREFLHAIVGINKAFGLNGSISQAIGIAILVGIPVAVAWKKVKALPIAVFASAYILAFTLSGNDYAVRFPWYFVPPLVAFYLFAGFGIDWALSFGKVARAKAIILPCLAALWAILLVAHNRSEAYEFRNGIAAFRERPYAAATVWLGDYLPDGSTIVCGEVGAIGFYSRPDVRVHDTFGLTRPISDRRAPIEFIEEVAPEAMIFWLGRQQKFRDFQRFYPGYEWGELNSAAIGIRNDIAPKILENAGELPVIYNSLDMRREYDWDAK